MTDLIKPIINEIKNLPDNTLESVGLLPDFEQNHTWDTAFNLLRKQYRAISSWLEYYLLGHSEFYFELIHTDKCHYKPLAERSIAIYKLAQECYLLSGDMQFKELNPETIWYAVEYEICKRIIDNNLINNSKVLGKRSQYEKTVSDCEQFADIEQLKCIGMKTTYSVEEFLKNTAIEIGKHPENVEFRTHWGKFLKTVKQCDDNIRRNKKLGIYCIVNNKVKML